MYSGKNKCSNKHMKRCLAALIIKEIRIKTTKKCYFFYNAYQVGKHSKA